MQRGLIASGLAFLIIASGACSLLTPELDRAAAIARAQEVVGGPVDAVVAATWKPTLEDGSAPSAPNRGVWRVEFRTSFEEPCGPAPGGSCLVERVVVLLGSSTGEVLGVERSGRQAELLSSRRSGVGRTGDVPSVAVARVIQT